jgi:lipopolysaccharide/colanic/teichoic acid biosynthesis glycosyltransferase
MLKRLFDVTAGLFGLIVSFPVFVIIAILIVSDSRGGIFYLQKRVGKGNRDFKVIKFRTMYTGAHKHGLLTIGATDSRVTRVGRVLRKFKLDELPQLVNVVKGDMSFVGPRPEVRRYVDLYTPDQMRVLTVRPGLTDYASIHYMDENNLLAESDSPEQLYRDVIMQHKLSMNLEYIDNGSFWKDLGIILRTVSLIFFKAFK